MAKGLGRGLSALFGEDAVPVGEDRVKRLRLSEIEPNPNQPRRVFDEEKLRELGASIREHGLLQPVAVRKKDDGRYELISGERRLRASRLAKLTHIDAVVLDADEYRSSVLSLVENLQREDLNPIETALGYRRLMSGTAVTQEEIAKLVGRSRPSVGNSLRLLSLPEEVQLMVADGSLSEGHAKVLLSADGAEAQLRLAKKCVAENLSVRSLEAAVKSYTHPRKKTRDSGIDYYDEAAKTLSQRIGRRVSIKNGAKKGVLTIEYYGNDDLNVLLDFLGEK